MKADKLAKDLQEDKETLRHCLDNSDSQPGLHKDVWWKNDNTVISVAKILNRWTQFSEISEVIDFFEAPYKYEDKMRFIIEGM